jgi:hypothetical protein
MALSKTNGFYNLNLIKVFFCGYCYCLNQIEV